MKKEGNKKHFRNAAKQAGLEFLESRLRETQRKLNSNKLQLLMLTKDQRSLKADIAGLHQVIQEYKK